MNKIYVFIFLLCSCTISFSQEVNETQQFWNSLQALCGKSFEGTLELPIEDEKFGGKRLLMHVRYCSDTIIKIPFFVGEDKSRTWILTYKSDRITLKHDHRHKDGSEDKITQYGGTTTNAGQKNIQIFPADEETKVMIPAASTNVWWITLDENEFTYNLRRIGTSRVFRVVMDITKPVNTPEAPWGWKE
ncbi:hypothetical protein [Aquimarina sediminis]|uniref:hypothetical protein n=1 Tax=Aquimarina sediminis TaxID=2070536 RepID=UPI000CA07DDF|nr:hypothetical protein [Aquimarina sediminis]